MAIFEMENWQGNSLRDIANFWQAQIKKHEKMNELQVENELDKIADIWPCILCNPETNLWLVKCKDIFVSSRSVGDMSSTTHGRLSKEDLNLLNQFVCMTAEKHHLNLLYASLVIIELIQEVNCDLSLSPQVDSELIQSVLSQCVRFQKEGEPESICSGLLLDILLALLNKERAPLFNHNIILPVVAVIDGVGHIADLTLCALPQGRGDLYPHISNVFTNTQDRDFNTGMVEAFSPYKKFFQEIGMDIRWTVISRSSDSFQVYKGASISAAMAFGINRLKTWVGAEIA